jgi:methionyl-tRNA formyltransferase
MMSEKLKIYFAGSGRIAVPVLETLCKSEAVEVVGVGTQPDRPVGRKKVLTPTPLGAAAAELGIRTLHKFDNINAPDALEAIRACAPQMMVVLSYGQLLKQPILELPPMGCINIHGSLLPRWRGASPVQQVLLHCEKETGVCFMQMEKGLDSGPVFETFSMEIPPSCGADALEMMLGELAAEKSVSTLLGISSGALKPVPQIHEEAVVCRKITREDGAVDWQKSAGEIEAMSRAYEGWPGAYFTFRVDGVDTTVTLNSARVVDTSDGALPGTLLTPGNRKKMVIACGKNALELLTLTPAGRKSMPVSAFLNGVRGEQIEFLPGIIPDHKTL